jgi:hypothetical protein
MNPIFQKCMRSSLPAILSVVVIFLGLFFLTITVEAQTGGTFPGEPFNGLQIDYSVSGADLESPEDEPGYTWYRRQNGNLNSRKLVVSGVAHASAGWGARLVVQISADGAQPVEFKSEKFPEGGLLDDPMEQPFSVSMNIPSGAENASYSINLVGEYNAGSRGVVISGDLAGGQVQSSAGISPIVIVILVGGVATAVIVGGAVTAIAAATLLKKTPRVPKLVRAPQVKQTIEAHQKAAQLADLEAEKYIRQWEQARTSGDPNDPEYQRLKQKYQDYIDFQRQKAAESRRQAQEIEAQEKAYEQEVREQEAYREHREAESEFIEREGLRQSRREGAFDRELDQRGLEQQQRLEQLKAERKAYRDNLRKDLIEARQAVEMATANQHMAASVVSGALENTVEWVQWGADRAIDVIAQIAPGTKPIKTAYVFTRGAASGAGEAWADKPNWKSHLAMGFKKGTVDAVVYVIKDKPLEYGPEKVKNFLKPKWVNLPGNTKIANVNLKDWGRGTTQMIISKARSAINPIVYGGEYLEKLKF